MSELKKAIIDANEKLDKVASDINEIKIIQTGQASDLKHHIRRSDQNEYRIDLIEDKLMPLIAAKNRMEGAFKVIGIAAAALGLIVGTLKIILELF